MGPTMSATASLTWPRMANTTVEAAENAKGALSGLGSAGGAFAIVAAAAAAAAVALPGAYKKEDEAANSTNQSS